MADWLNAFGKGLAAEDGRRLRLQEGAAPVTIVSRVIRIASSNIASRSLALRRGGMLPFCHSL